MSRKPRPVWIPRPDVNNGNCSTCGASYADWEFGMDHVGRLLLQHRCDPARLNHVEPDWKHHRYEHDNTPDMIWKRCVRCNTGFLGTSAQKRCLGCIRIHNLERNRKANRKRGQAARPVGANTP